MTTIEKAIERIPVLTEFTARLRIWGAMQTVRVAVDAAGYAMIWDDVAGHYVVVAGLSDSQRRRLTRMSRSERA